ncbi:hypothetical protein K7X08_003618 [Anisodus acutangulus]|uniref:Uncharacterized protein n=1 Tax=Anisodus acutangulus TaxID=402998 RepID=A0A9Q1RJK6_9SOLA|nr:hypothetical protein K7X08_003618 [Anisodus acutangulus]
MLEFQNFGSDFFQIVLRTASLLQYFDVFGNVALSWNELRDVDILFEMFVHPFSSQPFNFTFTDRREATHHFPSANFLDEGGFGPVYNVDNKLGPGLKAQVVAVKVLDTLGLRGYKEWLVPT